MNGIWVYVLFAVAAVVIGGAGFLIQSALNKSDKLPVRIVPAICVVVWIVYMIIKPVFFFFYVLAGLLLPGMGAALLLYFIRSKRKQDDGIF